MSPLNVNINGHIMCRIDNDWSFTIADMGARCDESKKFAGKGVADMR